MEAWPVAEDEQASGAADEEEEQLVVAPDPCTELRNQLFAAKSREGKLEAALAEQKDRVTVYAVENRRVSG